MANVLNPDFSDFILALNDESVEYILVGGYAVIYHGYDRTTGDLDLWINPTSDNYQKLQKAFERFGMDTFDMVQEKFLDTSSYDVFTFGRPPVCIEILTKVKGLEFNDCFKRSSKQLFDNIPVQMIDIRDLIAAKKAANRYKDKDDLEHLNG